MKNILFEKDSVNDLILRGFPREYILDKTGFDVGYKNSNVRGKFKNIDKDLYKAAYVRNTYSDDELLYILNSFSYDIPLMTSKLGLYGDKISFPKLFKSIGLYEMYHSAIKKLKAERTEETNLKRYGVKRPLQSDSVKEKMKQTNIEKYGTEHPMQNSEIRKKATETIINRYGVDNVAKVEKFSDKAKATMLKKYGVEHALQNPDIMQKFITTNNERYGANAPIQNKEIHDKMVKTVINKYGVDNVAKSEDIQDKIKQTNIKRYGVERPTQSEFIKEKTKTTNIEKYGVAHILQNKEVRAKAIKTYLTKYGVNNPAKNKDVQAKIIETKRKNHTFNTSKPEELLYEMLVDKFGKDDVLRQYNKDERYPFMCDFYIKSRDLFIELNAYWTHGDHWFNPNSKDDIEKLNSWYSVANEHEHYYNAIDIWTRADVKKRKTAEENNLNYIVFWDTHLSDALSWFDNGCPDLCDL